MAMAAISYLARSIAAPLFPRHSTGSAIAFPASPAAAGFRNPWIRQRIFRFQSKAATFGSIRARADMWLSLSVKDVPRTGWSSDQALNWRPPLFTLLLLCAGLFLLGVGESLLIAAGAGVSPWTVLAQGIENQTGLSIGWATFSTSVIVLLLWIPLKETPGLGTILNAFVVAAAMDWSLQYLPRPQAWSLQLLEVGGGILLFGAGSGLYLIANLGPGPRDGLMTGLQRLSGWPVALVRGSLEVSVVALGWLLGGTVGYATVLFALLIGPSVSLGLYWVARLSPATEPRL